MQHINLAAIAKVCDTDVISIEQILREIVAQVKDHLKNGCNVRLMMKIGKLVSRNGCLHWKSNHEPEMDAQKGGDVSSQISRFSNALTHASASKS